MHPTTITTIIMDLDGTLLSSKRTVLPFTKKILSELQKRGILLGFASGRSAASAQAFTDLFSSQLPLTLFNGSLIIDSISKEVLYSIHLDSTIVSELIRITRNTSLHLHLYTENQVYLDMEDALLYKKIDPITYESCQPIENMSNSNTLFIKAMITGDETETLGWKILSDLEISHPNSFYAVSTFKNHIEIMNPLANKKNGLDLISRRHQIPLSSILAFGDADNDREMLMSVGWGVAMGNCSPSLKAYVDDVTADNDSDGIGHYLANVFGLSS